MVRPYSLDLRERVVAAAEAGQSCRAAAKPRGGRRPVKLAGQRAFILERIAIKPHITIRGLMAELAERGAVASYGAVRNFLHRHRQSYKKKPARQRTGSARRRPPPRPLEAASAPD
jgi:transposase